MNSQVGSLSKNPLVRYLPGLLMMLAIFLFSAGTAVHSPDRLLGLIVNKGGHMIGYGILALAYWRIFEFSWNRRSLAWLLAVLYALTDEFHQSLVPGRHPSLFDVFVFDNFGALIALWLAGVVLRRNNQAGRTWSPNGNV
jgi:hypothetical protein